MSVASEATKILINGGVTAGVVRYYAGFSEMYSSTLGMNLPTLAVGFAAGAAASMLVDGAHEWIMPQISKDAKMQNREALVLAAVVSGVSVVGAFWLLNSGAPAAYGVQQLFFLGVVSELAAHLVYELWSGNAAN